MGTNFYFIANPETKKPWTDDIEESDIRRHIGKRSIAGSYCDKCDIVLPRTKTNCTGLTDCTVLTAFLSPSRCPSCGEPRGYMNCACSFTLTKQQHFYTLLDLGMTLPKEHMIVDEYEETYTAAEMIKIIEDCPIRLHNPAKFS